MVDEAEAQWAMRETEHFTERLRTAGVPEERGCDGAYLEARRFLPGHRQYAAHALAAAIYLSSGVRAVVPGPAPEAPDSGEGTICRSRSRGLP